MRRGRKVPSSTQPMRISPSASSVSPRQACCAIVSAALPA